MLPPHLARRLSQCRTKYFHSVAFAPSVPCPQQHSHSRPYLFLAPATLPPSVNLGSSTAATPSSSLKHRLCDLAVRPQTSGWLLWAADPSFSNNTSFSTPTGFSASQLQAYCARAGGAAATFPQLVNSSSILTSTVSQPRQGSVSFSPPSRPCLEISGRHRRGETLRSLRGRVYTDSAKPATWPQLTTLKTLL